MMDTRSGRYILPSQRLITYARNKNTYETGIFNSLVPPNSRVIVKLFIIKKRLTILGLFGDMDTDAIILFNNKMEECTLKHPILIGEECILKGDTLKYFLKKIFEYNVTPVEYLNYYSIYCEYDFYELNKHKLTPEIEAHYQTIVRGLKPSTEDIKTIVREYFVYKVLYKRCLYPYQQRDKIKDGTVLYGSVDMFVAYQQAKTKHTEFIKSLNILNDRYTLESHSQVDVSKMLYYINGAPKYTFLSEVCTDIGPHLQEIKKIIDSDRNDTNMFFVPHLPERVDYNDSVIYEMDRKSNIKIFDSLRFTNHIKTLENSGKIFYELIKIFNHYSDNTDEKRKDILKTSHKQLHGLNADEITKRIQEIITAKDEYEKLKKMHKVQTLNTQDEEKKLYEYLAKNTTAFGRRIRDLEEKLSILRSCNFRDLGEWQTVLDTDVKASILQKCRKTDIVPMDKFENAYMGDECHILLQQLNDEKLEANIKELFANSKPPINCHNHDFNLGQNTLELNIDFMPEFKKLLETKADKQQIHDNRQLILADGYMSNALIPCTRFFKSEVFVPRTCDLEFIQYDLALNKVLIYCQKDLLFPIRILNGTTIQTLTRYIPNQYSSEYIFIGSFVYDMSIEPKPHYHRPVRKSYYILYCFYDKVRGKIRVINYLNLLVDYGKVLEQQRPLYTEIDTLINSKNEDGLYEKIYFYKVKNTSNDEYSIYCSRYDKTYIYDKYRELYPDIVDKIMKLLIQVNISKDNETKEFRITEYNMHEPTVSYIKQLDADELIRNYKI